MKREESYDSVKKVILITLLHIKILISQTLSTPRVKNFYVLVSTFVYYVLLKILTYPFRNEID